MVFRGKTVGGTVIRDGTTLRIFGTDAADTLSASVASGKLKVIFNGVSHSYTSSKVKSIQADLQGGDDHVDFSAIAIPVSLYGQAGNDTLIGGAGDDLLNGGLGADRFTGGAGDDTVSYSDRYDNLSLSLDGKANDGAPGEGDNIPADIESLVGGVGDDLITGTSGPDHLDGGPEPLVDNAVAHDTIIGLAGDDVLTGYDIDPGTGDDTLSGGNYQYGGIIPVGIADYSARTENMTVDLSNGTVSFASGEVDHLLDSALTFRAGSGNDRISDGFADGETYSGQTIDGGAGNDTITGGANDYEQYWVVLNGQAGNDQLSGGDVVMGGPGADTLTGDISGVTMLSYADRTTGVFIDLDKKTVTPSDGDVLTGPFGGVIGGSGNDTIFGTSDADSLYGGGGDDAIHGRGGDDSLRGEAGKDSLYGERGDDSLDGGAGADLLQGGSGIDLADYSNRTENLDLTLDGHANDGTAGEDDNIASDIENITGGSGSDRIVGNLFANDLSGGFGGNDTIFGGAGNDTLEASPSGRNLLVGQDGDDNFYSLNDQKDTLDGGAGKDSARVDSVANGSAVIDSLTSIETVS